MKTKYDITFVFSPENRVHEEDTARVELTVESDELADAMREADARLRSMVMYSVEWRLQSVYVQRPDQGVRFHEIA